MSSAHTRVAIIGGDPIVGEALEVLLQAAGYRAWFLPESAMDELGGLLADSQILLIAPLLSAERRKTLLEMLPNIPVLKLVPANGGQHLPGEHTVLWPCSREELKVAIDALLLNQGGSDPA